MVAWSAEEDLRTFVIRKDCDECSIGELRQACAYHGVVLPPNPTKQDYYRGLRVRAASDGYLQSVQNDAAALQRIATANQAAAVGLDVSASRSVALHQQFKDYIGSNLQTAKACPYLRSIVHAYITPAERILTLLSAEVENHVFRHVSNTLALWEVEEPTLYAMLTQTCNGVEGLPPSHTTLQLNDLVVVKAPLTSESTRRLMVLMFWSGWCRLAGEAIFASYLTEGTSIKWSVVRSFCRNPITAVKTARATAEFFGSEAASPASVVKSCHICGDLTHLQHACPRKAMKDGKSAGKKTYGPRRK